MPLSRVENPERVLIIQPRVGPQGLPWVSRQRRTTLKGLKRQLLKSCCNPFRVGLLLTSTQGRRFRANPGLSDCHPFRMAYTASTVHYMLKCSRPCHSDRSRVGADSSTSLGMTEFQMHLSQSKMLSFSPRLLFQQSLQALLKTFRLVGERPRGGPGIADVILFGHFQLFAELQAAGGDGVQAQARHPERFHRQAEEDHPPPPASDDPEHRPDASATDGGPKT